MTRQIAGETIIVPIAGSVGELNAIYTLNAMGTMVWEMLRLPTSDEAILQKLCREYEVAFDTAAEDLTEFLDSLRDAGLIRSSAQGGS
ncbi:MAG: PqqD family protein [Acidobacteria bacterium]|nr:PqqD family protein [Acidobacteriota bacterium]